MIEVPKLKLETLSLNDSIGINIDQTSSVVPIQTEVCHEVMLLWRQEPKLANLHLNKLYTRLKEKNPSWQLTESSLFQILSEHNLYKLDESTLFTYHDKVISGSTSNIQAKLLNKVRIEVTDKGRSLIAKQRIKKGELIFEESPLILIPPLDKITLVELSKACGKCGTSLNQKCHYSMMHGLDCDSCTTIWCSKRCKALDVTHSYLKHAMSKNKTCNAQKWMKFEKYTKEKSWYSAYAVGYIYASHIVGGQNESLFDEFLSLAEVSERERLKAIDSTNVGFTFDYGVDKANIKVLEGLWEEVFRMFCEVFPKVRDDEKLDLEKFLNLIGRFNINQVNGQIYLLLSHINHTCEPNTRVEFDKCIAKTYSRKTLEPGEEILITYINPLHDVSLRKRELRIKWGFLCECIRCKKDLSKKVSDEDKIESNTAPTEVVSLGHRRKSSMKASRPTLEEILENGQEFDLEIPSQPGLPQRRTSVRFDEKVIAALDE